VAIGRAAHVASVRPVSPRLAPGEPPVHSIIVPAFNAASTIASAVGSALAQTVTGLEVVVVDDGSTDSTADVVRGIADERVRLISQPNRGLPAARNAGIAVARGRYVSLLDSDDLLLPRYLELSHEALESSPGAGFAYTDAYVFDPVTGRVRQRTAMERANPPKPPPSDRDEFLLELLRRNFIYVAATISKDALDSVGGFDETRTSAEDYELWLRILIAGYRAAWTDSPQALYRKHAGQMSRKLVTMSRSLLDVYEAIRPEDLPSDAHRQLLAERRHRVARETRLLSVVAWAVPQGLVGVAKRAGVGEAWYDEPPAEVAAAFPDLRAV
jgi:glycosyltransferase involved in cell wall biosynthesis